MSDRVIDISRNRETGEIEQFTILDQGKPKLVKATPENLLLYDPDDDLPFDGGMSEFLSGQQALVFSQQDPKLMVAPTNNEYCYMLRVNDSTVETTPAQAEDILEAIKCASLDQNFQPLIDMYEEIMATQVRRDVISALMDTFDQSARITETANGWLVDDFYLVDWSASMYAQTDDPEEVDVMRSGSSVEEVDKSYEFVELNVRRDTNRITVSINGKSYKLSEREMLFLGKVKWLLGRRHYHPDTEFWMNADQYAAVDWETGEPMVDEDEDDERDEPDLDTFDL
jgi:hypothetical protein